MKLTSYLSKSRHGIFYFRYSTTDPSSSTRNCFKLSLRTRCPHTAKTLALSLGGFCSRLKLKGLLLSMKFEEIRELVTDYLADIRDERLKQIDQNGLPLDMKRTYRDAIKHINHDIKVGNDKAQDLFIPDEDFRTRCGVSQTDWLDHKDAILPEMRQTSADQFAEAIEYSKGDSTRVTERPIVPHIPNHHQNTIGGPQESSESLSGVMHDYIKERRQVGAVRSKHIDALKSGLDLLIEIVGEDKTLNSFDGSLVRDVKATLLALPKNRN